MLKRLPLLIAPLFLAGCLAHPPPPEAPYHGHGKASAWHLIIDDRNVTFIPVGGQPVVQPKPQVIVGIAGEIYRAGRIDVNLVHGPCQIGDRNFADRVQVSVDGKRHEGCGGEFTYGPAPSALPPLEGRSWRVVRINGRATPASGNYSLSFGSDGRLGARFGCNSIGGSFTRSGVIVTASNVIGTQMACSEPADSFESDGLKVLMQPMRASRSGEIVTLANGAGEIVLSPAA